MLFRSALAKDYMVEIDGMLISRREVMRRLNPEFSEAKIDELLAEIAEEKSMFNQVSGADPFSDEDEEQENAS